jgi:hypothetical protein
MSTSSSSYIISWFSSPSKGLNDGYNYICVPCATILACKWNVLVAKDLYPLIFSVQDCYGIWEGPNYVHIYPDIFV